uniref:Metalloendopeptidase OMA1, mitochondrial n=1 Tax=Strigamia maritima TaxID=126957 RepID=T1JFJ3_STRMM
ASSTKKHLFPNKHIFLFFLFLCPEFLPLTNFFFSVSGIIYIKFYTMIIPHLFVVSRRQQRLHSIMISTRYISSKISTKKRVQALKMWKLWPIPHLIREKPKPVSFFDRITGKTGTRYLAERSMTVGVLLVAFLSFFYATHVAETPVTHRKRFVILNSAVLEAVSDEVFNMYVVNHKQHIVSSRNQRYQVVERVANKIVQSNLDIPEVLNKDWTVTVVDEPSYNVFALPTGQILVYEGMLNMCKTDDQLAAVLGHELAHAILGHTAELANNLGLWDKIWMTGAMVMWSLLPLTHNFVAHYMATKMNRLFLNLPYNQLLEHEADKVGLTMIAKACFDVRESSAFWGRMETIQRMNFQHKIEWLYIHPDINRRRSKTVDRFLPEALRIRAENQCPPLPRHDPREDLGDFRQEIEQKLEKKPDEDVPHGLFTDIIPHSKSRVTEEIGKIGGTIQETTQGSSHLMEEREVQMSSPVEEELKQIKEEIMHGYEHLHEHQHVHQHLHDHEHAPDYRRMEPEDATKVYNHDGHYHRHGGRTPIGKRL